MTPEEMKQACLEAVDVEPELPNEMPFEMEVALLDAMAVNDIEFIVRVLRRTVAATKEGIADRINKITTVDNE